MFIILILLFIDYAEIILRDFVWDYAETILRDFVLFPRLKLKRNLWDRHHYNKIWRPKKHEIKIQRPRNRDIKIRGLKHHDIDK